MNLKEWAEKLNGREYGNELSYEEGKQLEEDGIVAVFGYSDDNMELEGAFRDELSAYVDTIYYWTGNGFVSNNRINEFLDYIDDEYREFYPLLKPLFENNTERSYIRSIPGDDCQFIYETNIPCEWFNVMEDGELYCKGFVFNKSDL